MRTRLFLQTPFSTCPHPIAITELGRGPVYSRRDCVIQLAVLLEEL